MISRRLLAGDGVQITTPRQIAELVDAEGDRLGMNRNKVSLKAGRANTQLNFLYRGERADVSFAVASDWLNAINCEFIFGGQRARDVTTVCRILDEARIAQEIPLVEARDNNSYTWARVRSVVKGKKVVNVQVGSILKMSSLLGLELWMRRAAQLSQKQQRMLALGVDPDRVAEVRTNY